MNGYQYIISRQTEWAKNQGIELIGSKGNRGRLGYTKTPDQNLFQPLLLDVKKAFTEGDGRELGSSDLPGKIQALHSSSALGVNIFQYWKSISQIPPIAAACGFCRRGSDISQDIQFEEKFPIHDRFRFHPNIDIVIHNKPGSEIQRFAVECKFSEPYGAYKHSGLKEKYLKYNTLWKDIPGLKFLAQNICPDDKDFKFFHAAQMIKHILTLKRHYGKNGFRLLYLWYDVPGEQGKAHQDEITQFLWVAKKDGIKFHSLTYQELIAKMAKQMRSQHPEYIKYLTERYL